MPKMRLHESRWRASLRLMQSLRIQNGPPLPLDRKLRWLLHPEAFLALLVLRDQSLLLHGRLDVHGSSQEKHDAYWFDCNDAFFSTQILAHNEIRFSRGKENDNWGQRETMATRKGKHGWPRRHFLLARIQRSFGYIQTSKKQPFLLIRNLLGLFRFHSDFRLRLLHTFLVLPNHLVRSNLNELGGFSQTTEILLDVQKRKTGREGQRLSQN